MGGGNLGCSVVRRCGLMRAISNGLMVCAWIALVWLVSLYANRLEPAPQAPAQWAGLAYSPYRHLPAQWAPPQIKGPNSAQLADDVLLLARHTRAVRTYSVDEAHLQLARKLSDSNLSWTVGAWLGPEPSANAAELARLDALLKVPSSAVARVLVGNETLLRGDLTAQELAMALRQVKRSTSLPVSTAEPWHVWLKHPELAQQVDFLAVHVLPYWEGIPLNRALLFVQQTIEQLRQAYPGKPVVLTEVGWPSQGRSVGQAQAGLAQQALFIRQFVQWADAAQLDYFLMEAFDQPWKLGLEGTAGTSWGLWDAEAQTKWPHTGAVSTYPQASLQAVLISVLGAMLALLMLLDSSRTRLAGRMALISGGFLAAWVLVIIGFQGWVPYLAWLSKGIDMLLGIAVVLSVCIMLVELHEWVEAVAASRLRTAPFVQPPVQPVATGDHCPMVSIHVPCCNEPPEMLIDTLNALSKLNYPRFEVWVVDNNTEREALWRPVQAHCNRLGAHFHFVHLPVWSGFKAGALNWALRHTHADATWVAVVDADYQVDPQWLRTVLPWLQHSEVGFIQCPQAFRDAHGVPKASLLKRAFAGEYAPFFGAGMVVRNERNAVIQHGTMTLVNKSALHAVGAWSEDCITEDTELGLRLMHAGYEAHYCAQPQGWGLTPDRFEDFCRQRQRWVVGGMQILRTHFDWHAAKRLKPAQRWHFGAGWLPWLADGLALPLMWAAVLWSVAMVWSPSGVDTPSAWVSGLPVAVMLMKGIKHIHLSRTLIRSPWRTITLGFAASLALQWTVAGSVWRGLIKPQSLPFFRTPKLGMGSVLQPSALFSEGLMAVLLMLSGVGVGYCKGLNSVETLMWIATLLTLALPQVCACAFKLLDMRTKVGNSTSGYAHIAPQGER